jgi:hypothetical protein
MRYAELPKALIPIHRGGRVRTPFEEHLLEGAHYTRSRQDLAGTHFTVAPEFRAEFDQALRLVAPRVSEEIPGVVLSVTFSEQHPSTDTLAVSPDGRPFREHDGSLLLRPAGHGALIQNLAATGADLVVLKNIDNVLPYDRSADVVEWKRLLIGYLAVLQRNAPSDRPLRVCGVVKNTGEPGGAPFWVRDPTGGLSLQIVEPSQVDAHDAEQRRIFASATHFSPVDIVCALRASSGEPFALDGFVDPSTAFQTRKSHQGRDLIALERPGLWNGAMAGWRTVFVEVPASTFAPVKTVFDLLRPEHQSL